MRSWEFVVVTDKSVRAELVGKVGKLTKASTAKLLDNWSMTDEAQREMYLDAIPKQQAMIYSAGCLILPFFKQEGKLLKPKTLSCLNEFASIWMCIENILLAAAAEGIFGVTRIPMAKETEHIRQVVGHPDDYIMPCYIALGYPKADAKVAEQKPITAKDKIHLNRWRGSE